MLARPEDATLLEVLADGFEKNETLGGWFWRQLPLPDAAIAARKYDELHAELLRWTSREEVVRNAHAIKIGSQDEQPDERSPGPTRLQGNAG